MKFEIAGGLICFKTKSNKTKKAGYIPDLNYFKINPANAIAITSG